MYLRYYNVRRNGNKHIISHALLKATLNGRFGYLI